MAQQIKITQTSNADMNIGVPKTQTAIDWLVEQVNSDCLNSTFIKHELVNQAKQMEKEQIMNAYNDGADHMFESKYEGMDKYYKLRYGSNNQI